jgi:hypothetical protein
MKPVEAEFDTVIVPAREEGFLRVFVGENKWYPIRLSPESRKRLKHIAVYRTAPISAVTHVADVSAVVALDDGRWSIELERIREVAPIKFLSHPATKTLQTPRLTRLAKLLSARNLNALLTRGQA